MHTAISKVENSAEVLSCLSMTIAIILCQDYADSMHNNFLHGQRYQGIIYWPNQLTVQSRRGIYLDGPY
jgi:hypothetical protein